MNPVVLTVYKSPFTKLRLGKDYDGGYIIAEIPNVSYTTFLSGGIETDISFEEDFIIKYPNVKAFAFDGTIHNLPKVNNNITFIKGSTFRYFCKSNLKVFYLEILGIITLTFTSLAIILL